MDNFSSPPPVTNSDAKTASIVSYITIIGWLVAYFALYKDNKTALAAFHLRQSLLLNLIVLAIIFATPVLFFIPFATMLIWAVEIALFVFWILGLIAAINEQRKPIPLIGPLAQSMFQGI